MSIRAIRKKNQIGVKETIFDVFSSTKYLHFISSLHSTRVQKDEKVKEFYNRIQNATSINIVCVFLCYCDEDNGMNVNWRVRWKLVYIKNLFLAFLLLSISHLASESLSVLWKLNSTESYTHYTLDVMNKDAAAVRNFAPILSSFALAHVAVQIRCVVLCNNSISATRWSSPRFDMRPNSRDCALAAHCRC